MSTTAINVSEMLEKAAESMGFLGERCSNCNERTLQVQTQHIVCTACGNTVTKPICTCTTDRPGMRDVRITGGPGSDQYFCCTARYLAERKGA
jgi:ribosomal protein S27E